MSGYISKVAGYWALAEKHVDQVEDSGSIIQYEVLCRELSRSLEVVLGESDIAIDDEDLVGESHTSGRSDDKQMDQRIYGWRDELSAKEVQEVERVVKGFEMEEALYQK